MRRLTPQRTFFWLIGILTIVLIATFGALYTQGNTLQATLHVVEMKQVAVQTTLKNLVRQHDNESNASVHKSRENDLER